MRIMCRAAPLLLLGVALVGCGGSADKGSGKSVKGGEKVENAVVADAFSANQVVLSVPGMS